MLRSRWKNLPISWKLAVIVGTMAVLVVAELFTMRYVLDVHSAVRAFISGENLWTKSQKNASFYLERYAYGHHEDDYRRFRDALRVPEAFRRAREEAFRPGGDLEHVRQLLTDTEIHPDDVAVMVRHLQRFRDLPPLGKSIDAWTKGEGYLDELARLGTRLHRAVLSGSPAELQAGLRRLRELNELMNGTERQFSAEINDGARWLEHRLFFVILLAVLLVEGVGITLASVTTRALSRGIIAIRDAAVRVGQGEAYEPLPAATADELGQAERAVNHMSQLIEESRGRLEQKVQARTRELEKLADENARLYQEASSAVQARDEFLSVASHELRNPLTALHLQLQLLERAMRSHSPGSSTPEEILHRCQAQSRRLRALLEELLDLTRLRLGRLELNRDRCDLSSLVCETSADFAIEAARAGSEIRIHAREPVVGSFDAVRMRQVVTNLLSNAIKYGEGRPIDVSVERSQGLARVTVRDRGNGIPAEEQGRIFDRFERATDDRNVPGLGLGLYVSKQITETHGGSIQVWSEPEKGAAFTVNVPLEAPTTH